MALTQSTLRSILVATLSVDERYIVPKQGNWFNPQDMLPTEQKPSTWIAYRISKAVPKMIPFLEEDSDGQRSGELFISKVDLQIVGTEAEELAQSMSHWLRRQDVKTAFENIDAVLLADRFSYYVLDFYQDGGNNILSYNVSFSVLWASFLSSTSGVPVTKTNITGTVLIPT